MRKKQIKTALALCILTACGDNTSDEPTSQQTLNQQVQCTGHDVAACLSNTTCLAHETKWIAPFGNSRELPKPSFSCSKRGDFKAQETPCAPFLTQRECNEKKFCEWEKKQQEGQTRSDIRASSCPEADESCRSRRSTLSWSVCSPKACDSITQQQVCQTATHCKWQQTCFKVLGQSICLDKGLCEDQ